MRILIDLDDTTAVTARRLAQAAGTTRKEWLEQTIAQATGSAEPEMVLGFWQITGSEVELPVCADCELPIIAETWLGMTSAFRVIGPLCAKCATNGLSV